MKGNFLPTEEHAKRLYWHSKGLTDKELGIKCNISTESAWCWRTRKGLPANGGSGRGGRRINTVYWQKGVTTNG